MITKRERIVAAFASKISALRCALLDGDSDLPARSIWDNSEEATRTKYGNYRVELSIPVEYFDKFNSANFSNYSSQANSMLGELIQDATSGDTTLGGEAISINYSSSEVIYPDDGAREIAVVASFTIVYEFENGDPIS